jgi:hypothetical protein
MVAARGARHRGLTRHPRRPHGRNHARHLGHHARRVPGCLRGRVLATLAWSEIRRRRILREATGDHVPDIRELDPCELALVTHGEPEARAVALLNLEPLDVVHIDNASARSIARAAPDEDAVVSTRDARRLHKEWTERMQSEAELAPRATTVGATGASLHAGSCRLEAGLAELVGQHGESRLETIETDADVDKCTHALRSDLVDRGYLLVPRHLAAVVGGRGLRRVRLGQGASATSW